jgi:hypothetical protein
MDIEQVNATLERNHQVIDGLTAFIWTGTFPDGKRRGALASRRYSRVPAGEALLSTQDGRHYRVKVEPSEALCAQFIVE